MSSASPEVFAHVLVVEDEPDLLEALVSYLNMEGMSAHGVSTLTSAQDWMTTHPLDILLLDLG